MSPETAELRAWTTARARAARAGVIAYRSDPQDGPVVFFAVAAGTVKHFADLAALAEFVASTARPGQPAEDQT